MKISKEFSKYAQDYESHNSIQKLVVEKLLALVKNKPKSILDLGCGSGTLCKNIEWEYEHFTGVDFAKGMLELHPKSKKIELINADFDDKKLFEFLGSKKYDYILSTSALQWTQDLEGIFKNISALKTPISLAIFTANTFKTLNQTASLESILYSPQEIKELQKRYFDANFELVEYRLEFANVREMFRYIKRSGVSGSRNLLSITQMKNLMKDYPLNYLEFEVVFISS